MGIQPLGPDWSLSKTHETSTSCFAPQICPASPASTGTAKKPPVPLCFLQVKVLHSLLANLLLRTIPVHSSPRQ